MAPRNYYVILEVTRDASLVEIKKSYRSLAQRFHPDLNPGDALAEERIKELNQAYGTLSDADQRARYDRVGHAPAAVGFGAVAEAFEGLWSDLRGRRKRAAGRDLRYTLEINLAEAVFGGDKTIRFPTRRECEACDATGARQGGLKSCAACNGTGATRVAGGLINLSRQCTTCAGVGKVVVDACSVCGGAGMRGIQREFVVHIPAAMRDGAVRMVANEGEPGRRGGPPGDLHVVVRIKPHAFLTREGDDLVCELPVSISQAALGAVLHVPTLDGAVKMRVPEGTQSGRLLRLRGKGVPHGGARSERGDQLVRVIVETPTQLSPRQRDLLAALATESGEQGGAAAPASQPRRKRFLDKLREFARGDDG